MSNSFLQSPLTVVSLVVGLSVSLTACEKPPIAAEKPRFVKLMTITPSRSTQQL